MSLPSKSAVLPAFGNPPLHELVLSIQFAAVGLRNIDMSRVWDLFRTQYPIVEEKDPLPPVFETFGIPKAPVFPNIQFLGQNANVALMRYWFLDEKQSELIQIQSDRIIHNWRKTQPDDKYPRYDTLRPKLGEEIRTFADFVYKAGLGQLAPNQCEISYINHITLPDVADPATRPDAIFKVWRHQTSIGMLERASLGASFVISGDGDEPFGRLNMQAIPATHHVTGNRLVQLTMTMRGKPPEATIESALAWLDKGHEYAVLAFADLTQPEMHELWGMKNG